MNNTAENDRIFIWILLALSLVTIALRVDFFSTLEIGTEKMTAYGRYDDGGTEVAVKQGPEELVRLEKSLQWTGQAPAQTSFRPSIFSALPANT